jgi:hypothetical protein
MICACTAMLNTIIVEFIVPIRIMRCLRNFPLLSAPGNLSLFQLLPASLITDFLQLFVGLPLFLLS